MGHQNIWELQGFLLNRQVRRGQVVKSMLKSSRAKLVLDVGCAEGFITNFLSQLPAYVIGIDLDESIKIAKSKVSRADFIRVTITHLPFKNECFDAITLLEILEHLPNNILNEGIKEVDRVLKPGGTLLISVPYKEKITYTRCIHCGKLTPLWGHLQSFDENKLASLIPKNYEVLEKKHLPNLGLISCSIIFRWMPLRIWLLMNDLLGIIRKGYWILLKYAKEG
ncbi:MAG: class I SAM-dependent methyltransferase [Candidatus Baldrarchaeia archaeon]